MPPPLQFEAPGSWLSRLALAQGCDLSEVMQLFGFGAETIDIDLRMHSEALLDMRRRCRLPAESFGIAGRVMRNFHKAQLDAASLLAGAKGIPRYRYCPLCLGQRRVPHFDIQWRFVDWRYCPDHNCLMEDVCWRCRAPVTFPVDMAQSRAGRKGYASQGRCMSCAADLSGATPCRIDPSSSKVITELEACWLFNGRAMLAALFCGTALFRAEGIGTTAIGQRLHDEWLPSKETWSMTEHRLRGTGAGLSLQDMGESFESPWLFDELKTPWGTALTVQRSDRHLSAPDQDMVDAQRKTPRASLLSVPKPKGWTRS